MLATITRIIRAASLILAMLSLAFVTESLSAPGGTGSSGPPDGYGPGTHGRQKDDGDKGVLQGLVFGDQWVIVRDLTAAEDGAPIYFKWDWPPGAYNAEGDFEPPVGVYPTGYSIVSAGNGCVQPVSYDPIELDDGAEPQEQYVLPGPPDVSHYDSYGRERLPTYLIPLDPECKIPVTYESTWGTHVMEAESGRFNISRSPQAVMDAAYEEVLNTINQASQFDLDPAGRLMMVLLDEEGAPYWKTIDSPSENLALYQKLLWDGCFTATADIALTNAAQLTADGFDYLVCADETVAEEPDDEDFLRAAAFLAGAGDKTGRITVDLLVYLNNRLGVNDIIWTANKKGIESIGYYDFQGFAYDRNATHFYTFATLLQPISEAENETQFEITVVDIYDKIFTHDWPTGLISSDVDMDTPIINFVRAADDSLAIIYYIHNYAVPVNPVEPVVEPVYPITP